MEKTEKLEGLYEKANDFADDHPAVVVGSATVIGMGITAVCWALQNKLLARGIARELKKIK